MNAGNQSSAFDRLVREDDGDQRGVVGRSQRKFVEQSSVTEANQRGQFVVLLDEREKRLRTRFPRGGATHHFALTTGAVKVKLTMLEQVNVSCQSAVSHSVVKVAVRQIATHLERRFVDDLPLSQTFADPSARDDEQMSRDGLEQFRRQRTEKRFVFVADD